MGVSLNDDGGIQIDGKLETTVKGIYAVGDATGGWMLSHAASSMAVVAAENAMGAGHVIEEAVQDSSYLETGGERK